MSSASIVGQTRGGDAWTPMFVESLDATTCIGCGRCYKVCSRNVFDLVSRSEVLDEHDLDDDDELFDDDNAMVMTIANAADCIGCEACSKVCPKDCRTHTAA